MFSGFFNTAKPTSPPASNPPTFAPAVAPVQQKPADAPAAPAASGGGDIFGGMDVSSAKTRRAKLRQSMAVNGDFSLDGGAGAGHGFNSKEGSVAPSESVAPSVASGNGIDAGGRKKRGVTAASSAAWADLDKKAKTRARLERFYSHYNPSKLEAMDKALATYEGREDEMFTALVKKYGPEPPMTDAAVGATPTTATATPSAAAPAATGGFGDAGGFGSTTAGGFGDASAASGGGWGTDSGAGGDASAGGGGWGSTGDAAAAAGAGGGWGDVAAATGASDWGASDTTASATGFGFGSGGDASSAGGFGAVSSGGFGDANVAPDAASAGFGFGSNVDASNVAGGTSTGFGFAAAADDDAPAVPAAAVVASRRSSTSSSDSSSDGEETMNERHRRELKAAKEAITLVERQVAVEIGTITTAIQSRRELVLSYNTTEADIEQCIQQEDYERADALNANLSSIAKAVALKDGEESKFIKNADFHYQSLVSSLTTLAGIYKKQCEELKSNQKEEERRTTTYLIEMSSKLEQQGDRIRADLERATRQLNHSEQELANILTRQSKVKDKMNEQTKGLRAVKDKAVASRTTLEDEITKLEATLAMKRRALAEVKSEVDTVSEKIRLVEDEFAGTLVDIGKLIAEEEARKSAHQTTVDGLTAQERQMLRDEADFKEEKESMTFQLRTYDSRIKCYGTLSDVLQGERAKGVSKYYADTVAAVIEGRRKGRQVLAPTVGAAAPSGDSFSSAATADSTGTAAAASSALKLKEAQLRTAELRVAALETQLSDLLLAIQDIDKKIPLLENAKKAAAAAKNFKEAAAKTAEVKALQEEKTAKAEEVTRVEDEKKESEASIVALTADVETERQRAEEAMAVFTTEYAKLLGGAISTAEVKAHLVGFIKNVIALDETYAVSIFSSAPTSADASTSDGGVAVTPTLTAANADAETAEMTVALMLDSLTATCDSALVSAATADLLAALRAELVSVSAAAEKVLVAEAEAKKAALAAEDAEEKTRREALVKLAAERAEKEKKDAEEKEEAAAAAIAAAAAAQKTVEEEVAAEPAPVEPTPAAPKPSTTPAASASPSVDRAAAKSPTPPPAAATPEKKVEVEEVAAAAAAVEEEEELKKEASVEEEKAIVAEEEEAVVAVSPTGKRAKRAKADAFALVGEGEAPAPAADAETGFGSATGGFGDASGGFGSSSGGFGADANAGGGGWGSSDNVGASSGGWGSADDNTAGGGGGWGSTTDNAGGFGSGGFGDAAGGGGWGAPAEEEKKGPSAEELKAALQSEADALEAELNTAMEAEEYEKCDEIQTKIDTLKAQME